MSINVDALFGNMAKAEIFGSGTYFEDGQHEVSLKNLFVKEGHKGQSFIAEFTVIQSSNPEVQVGATRSYVLKFENMYTMANVTKLVMALLGYENTQANQKNPAIRKEIELVTRAVLGSETAKAELGEAYQEGLLTGTRIRVECTKVDTKPSAKNPQGGVRTDHSWSPIAA